MRYVIIALLLLSASCSPQRKLERVIKKNPGLIQVISRDTTYIDTVKVPGLVLDTIAVTSTVDTIVVKEGGLTTHIYRYYDTLRVHSVLEPQEIIREIEVKEVIKEIKVRHGLDWNKIIRWIALVIISVSGAIFGSKFIGKLNLRSWLGK